MEKFNIAIDGPAGAGKSTIARLVARALGFVYVDTGAMYRAVTWKVQQEGLLPDQELEVAALANRMQIELIPREEGQQVIVDGVDVTKEIRMTAITDHVSQIASYGAIRQLLVSLQKQMAITKGVVMDGRDIGTHVMPDAEIKVFLTASVKERAERRFKEMQNSGTCTLTLSELEQDIARRDQLDQDREISPLRRAHDAVLMDSTSMTIEEVVDEILGLCKDKVGGGK
ncbi:(d)CMP kinase [Paenibacillus frigoriresistens]|uniref:(d)CMP kinase n=1 Tax=Paenibacillus alginolyticus TaxID=59839 RepID=UPI001566959C|nr:(d)CMP kinase [Paenibacillus frigoriresistens]NRF89682.1 (d)CMP kinase [Paenibacillus frigoriresistens]